MRIHPTLDYGDNASAQVVHKAVQSQVHVSKVGAHRYERRKAGLPLHLDPADVRQLLLAIQHIPEQ